MSQKVKRRSRLLWSRWSMASLSGYFSAMASTMSKAKLNSSAWGKVRDWRTPFSSSTALMNLAADILLAGPGPDDALPHHLLVRLLAGDDHRAEHALLAAHGDHAVGGGGVVEDAVPLVQNLGVLPHLHLQLAGEDDVELLAGVGGQVDGPVLLGLVVVVDHVVGLRQLVAEQWGQVADLDALLRGGALPLSLAGDSVAGEVGAVALQQVGDADAEGQGALVDEGEGQVRQPRLEGAVLGQRGVRQLGHLHLGVAGDLPHLLDAACHLCQLVCYAIGFHLYKSSLTISSVELNSQRRPVRNKKNSSQRKSSLRRVINNYVPAVPLKLHSHIEECHSQAPTSPMP